MKKNTTIVSIRTDHGNEFQNQKFKKFCNENGISHNFLTPRTPQQNRMIEKKNRTLEEMTQKMLCNNELPRYVWA